jgi:hypothetical protein
LVCHGSKLFCHSAVSVFPLQELGEENRERDFLLKAAKEINVPKEGKNHPGIRNLLIHYKTIFRTPENLDHYLASDLRAAEKKFLKYALLGLDLPKKDRVAIT